MADMAQGRDNNLNLIRVLAATAVLISHAVPIALGPAVAEPLVASVGYSLGSLSVMIFFVISGYLITLSFERTASHREFAMARIMRIFPGLIVNLLFVALLLGPLVTVLAPAAYFSDPQSYLFILRNTLLVPLLYSLPGVFEGQPVDDIVGSIWTLRHEVGCYLGVFILGLLGFFRFERAFRLLSCIYVIALWPLVVWLDLSFHPLIGSFLKLSVPFVVGMMFYAWRGAMSLSLWGIAGTAFLAWVFSDTVFYHSVLSIAVGYATFWAGYIPGGLIRAYNRFGDYSYGIYIYAFPVQGWAIWAFGPQSALENVIYALPPTIFLSILSWHWVEKPAMRMAKPARPVAVRS